MWCIKLFFNDVQCIALQRDSTIARLLFGSIFKSIFNEIEKEKTEREARETVENINRCLNDMLDKSTQYFPPFVNCVLVRTCI